MIPHLATSVLLSIAPTTPDIAFPSKIPVKVGLRVHADAVADYDCIQHMIAKGEALASVVKTQHPNAPMAGVSTRGHARNSNLSADNSVGCCGWLMLGNRKRRNRVEA
jgi:hypothetical protein